MNTPVCVRFAPSPTGPLHLGGVRTALYNYLFAKKHGGQFMLRIEDTDQTRFVPGAEQYIMESLRWCGLQWDEGPEAEGQKGPYRQSERKPMYRQYAEQLIQSGKAYYAFDTAEELDEVRERMKASGNNAWQYNSITRVNMKNSLTLPSDEVQRRLDSGEPYVIRLLVPRNTEIKVNDLIRGVVVVKSEHIDDKVLFKSDGMPTYHLANVVDDHLMGITHVIRGEEWLPSAPLHVLLYASFGWTDTMPKFAHLPLILKPDGNGKLSKRDGDRLGFPVFPLEWKDPVSGEISSGYREGGWYKEAVVNLVALLGWHPSDNQEVFSLEELIEAFSLEKVAKAGAKFDVEKARWFNQHYLRQQTDADLLRDLKPHFQSLNASEEGLLKTIALVRDRAVFPADVVQDVMGLLQAPNAYQKEAVESKWKVDSGEKIEALGAWLSGQTDSRAEFIGTAIKSWLAEKNWGIGSVMPLVRIALTGGLTGPDIFETIALLGLEESRKRIEAFHRQMQK
ncbi:MAG: glutamate--tRNA ligase [Flavobacteriales bacterium]|jgi:glutamyl-tRNA synthetase|nr:glutamate--tRNA ligase [Bacteroidota bacterium]